MTSVSEQPRIGGEGLFERRAAGASVGADSCRYHKFWKPEQTANHPALGYPLQNSAQARPE
jgi:hypothetical protein